MTSTPSSWSSLENPSATEPFICVERAQRSAAGSRSSVETGRRAAMLALDALDA